MLHCGRVTVCSVCDASVHVCAGCRLHGKKRTAAQAAKHGKWLRNRASKKKATEALTDAMSSVSLKTTSYQEYLRNLPRFAQLEQDLRRLSVRVLCLCTCSVPLCDGCAFCACLCTQSECVRKGQTDRLRRYGRQQRAQEHFVTFLQQAAEQPGVIVGFGQNYKGLRTERGFAKKAGRGSVILPRLQRHAARTLPVTLYDEHGTSQTCCYCWQRIRWTQESREMTCPSCGMALARDTCSARIMQTSVRVELRVGGARLWCVNPENHLGWTPYQRHRHLDAYVKSAIARWRESHGKPEPAGAAPVTIAASGQAVELLPGVTNVPPGLQTLRTADPRSVKKARHGSL